MFSVISETRKNKDAFILLFLFLVLSVNAEIVVFPELIDIFFAVCPLYLFGNFFSLFIEIFVVFPSLKEVGEIIDVFCMDGRRGENGIVKRKIPDNERISDRAVF